MESCSSPHLFPPCTSLLYGLVISSAQSILLGGALTCNGFCSLPHHPKEAEKKGQGYSYHQALLLPVVGVRLGRRDKPFLSQL